MMMMIIIIVIINELLSPEEEEVLGMTKNSNISELLRAYFSCAKVI
jgi:hypothetical protein